MKRTTGAISLAMVAAAMAAGTSHWGGNGVWGTDDEPKAPDDTDVTSIAAAQAKRERKAAKRLRDMSRAEARRAR